MIIHVLLTALIRSFDTGIQCPSSIFNASLYRETGLNIEKKSSAVLCYVTLRYLLRILIAQVTKTDQHHAQQNKSFYTRSLNFMSQLQQFYYQ